MGKTEAYLDKLTKLSTSELARSAKELVKRERRNVAALIAHLSEMARRRAHLEIGYKSLFDYCVRHLRLSEGSVWNRLQVANVCRKLPQVLEHLAAGKISLTVAGRIASKLTGENVEKLLSECEGRTRREVEEILVALDPKPEISAGIRKAPARVTPQSEAKASPVGEPTQAAAVRKSRAKLEPAQAERYNFRFCAGTAFKEKLERLAEVMGTDAVEQNMAEILEKALDMALDKKDPKRKLERRQKKAASGVRPRPDEAPVTQEKTPPKRSRYITLAVRERVLEAAAYQCEYRGAGGVRCSARAGLEVDHVKPYGKGGANTPENLRVLCKRHNLFMAVKEYGEEFLQGKMAMPAETVTASSSSGRGLGP